MQILMLNMNDASVDTIKYTVYIIVAGRLYKKNRASRLLMKDAHK